ncbi:MULTISPECIES: hypothetical protein [Sphingobacterium]|uniref:hypothetical protein n=1 Tax=Sphingobacterium TaxID=28453 RepID=UPI0016036C4B|nr:MULTISPECIES: hypothetical protein [Sphingobacterium]MBB1645466.1 hypothetical protein [Sphingobacterium sp. UME9]
MKKFMKKLSNHLVNGCKALEPNRSRAKLNFFKYAAKTDPPFYINHVFENVPSNPFIYDNVSCYSYGYDINNDYGGGLCTHLLPIFRWFYKGKVLESNSTIAGNIGRTVEQQGPVFKTK